MLARLLKNLFSRGRPASTPAVVDGARLLHQADAALQEGLWVVAEQRAQQLIAAPEYEADARHILAVVAYQRSDTGKALELVESSVALDPEGARFHNTRGKILASLGRFPDALAAYERAIALAPGCGGFFLNYASARKFSAEDLPLIESLEERLRTIPQGGDDRIHFEFAIGKALDDCALYDRAFPYFKRANDARFASQPFAIERFIEYVETLKEVFDEAFMARHRPPARPADIQPLFIIGMPRSGSTLLESLLCRASGIVAGGELRAMENVVNSVARSLSRSLPYPQCLREVAALPLRELAQVYRDNLTPAVSASTRFTDKYLYNFLNVGLVMLLFPEARIVHVRRHPLDVCLSCYFTSFAQEHGFTYDIGTLCRYYGQYEDIMAHWHKLLPGLIVDVEYRDLAEAPDATIESVRRRLEGAAPREHGGEAHPAPAIRTASAWQARQPVYRSSINRWRNYANHIAPFVEALRRAGVSVELEPTSPG
jgi:tetratricopeptide (TPR) repeat protein